MKYLQSFFLILITMLLLTACGGGSRPHRSAERHFLEGEKYFEKHNYQEAINSWEKVRDAYYSPQLSMLAELKIAEAYYVAERFDEAATAFNDFLQNHPNDNRTATVLYRLGSSYFHQMLSADRDQTNTTNALKTFRQLLQRFPDNANADQARQLIRKCRIRLADHEVYVAAFYVKKEHYSAAITRLEKMLNEFPDYDHRDEAFFHLGHAYLQSDNRTRAEAFFAILFSQFPSSDFADEARELLEAID